MCRTASYGGLGVTSVKYNAMAVLIQSFLETSANPKFRKSLLHSALYNYYVLGDTSIPDPGYLHTLLPCSFLWHHQACPCRYSSECCNHKYKSMGPSPDWGGAYHGHDWHRVHPMQGRDDWSKTWMLVRLKGLDSHLASFNFKLLHGPLVAKGRKNQINPASSATCTHCNDQDLQHPLLFYHAPTMMELASHSWMPLNLRLATSLLSVSTCLLEVWMKRFSRTRIRLY